MSIQAVAVIDYGLGNLFSVCRAVESAGGKPELVSNPNELAHYPRVILPGVGAFPAGMKALSEKGFIPVLKDLNLRAKQPLLGICLGMQVLLEEGEEFTNTQGLGLIPGIVKEIPVYPTIKVPHIGWSAITPSQKTNWTDPFLKSTQPGDYVYFVHSFSAQVTHPEHLLAQTQYSDLTIQAVIGKDLIWGVQFHPEKSGPVGIKMLRSFLTL